METIKSQVGDYTINKYKIPVTFEMKNDALSFAIRLIGSANQYLRMTTQEALDNDSLKILIETQRTYVGKLAELAFLNLLHEKNIITNTKGMFEIYEGQDIVDDFDFETSNGKSIDVKAGFRENHRLLLINYDQFTNNHKDFYIGVKLNGKDLDYDKKIIDWNSITHAIIEGYADYTFLSTKLKPRDFGEGLALGIDYKRLMGIDRLLNTM